MADQYFEESVQPYDYSNARELANFLQAQVKSYRSSLVGGTKNLTKAQKEIYNGISDEANRLETLKNNILRSPSNEALLVEARTYANKVNATLARKEGTLNLQEAAFADNYVEYIMFGRNNYREEPGNFAKNLAEIALLAQASKLVKKHGEKFMEEKFPALLDGAKLLPKVAKEAAEAQKLNQQTKPVSAPLPQPVPGTGQVQPPAKKELEISQQERNAVNYGADRIALINSLSASPKVDQTQIDLDTHNKLKQIYSDNSLVRSEVDYVNQVFVKDTRDIGAAAGHYTTYTAPMAETLLKHNAPFNDLERIFIATKSRATLQISPASLENCPVLTEIAKNPDSLRKVLSEAKPVAQTASVENVSAKLNSVIGNLQPNAQTPANDSRPVSQPLNPQYLPSKPVKPFKTVPESKNKEGKMYDFGDETRPVSVNELPQSKKLKELG